MSLQWWPPIAVAKIAIIVENKFVSAIFFVKISRDWGRGRITFAVTFINHLYHIAAMNTTLITLSPHTLSALLWVLAITVADYLCVVIAVAVDLRSAVLRARRQNVPRTSGGYRRTIAKLQRYLTTLLALTAVDALLVVTALMLRSTMQWAVPPLPLFSTVGAVAMALIEAKSVVENTQDARQYRQALRSLSRALDDRELHRLIDSLRSIAKGEDKL